ncbi:hypothetical protein DPMN_102368 [Dreissena polymorpha]|uniref:Uncharacterized protein n=1 Tax=Dreissena polymorpha TaxID=45954 RepID=A0A9D4LKD4_DREPO|nr:hypothetical protein DPMN_102368 [Dreissena polymorpha]
MFDFVDFQKETAFSRLSFPHQKALGYCVGVILFRACVRGGGNFACWHWTKTFLVESEAVRINRLKSTAEELLAEEQAGVRAGRSTVEQIFKPIPNLRFADDIDLIDGISSERAGAYGRSTWAKTCQRMVPVPLRAK